MAQSNQLPERVQEVDAIFPDPDERARVIWRILKEHGPDLTGWDLICFAQGALGALSIEHPWLKEMARELSSLVFKAHYYSVSETTLGTRINSRSDGNSESSEGNDTGPDEKSNTSE